MKFWVPKRYRNMRQVKAREALDEGSNNDTIWCHSSTGTRFSGYGSGITEKRLECLIGIRHVNKRKKEWYQPERVSISIENSLKKVDRGIGRKIINRKPASKAKLKHELNFKTSEPTNPYRCTRTFCQDHNSNASYGQSLVIITTSYYSIYLYSSYNLSTRIIRKEVVAPKLSNISILI